MDSVECGISDDVHYSSIKARNACLELGLPFSTDQIKSRDVINKERDTELSPNSFVATYYRALRLKSRRKSPAAATVFIGRYKEDYVTQIGKSFHTSPLTSSKLELPPVRGKKINSVMGKHLPKGILQLTKSFERNKRVTFNDDVTVEEFNSNSAIIQTVVRKQTGKDDVTEKNTDDATKVLPKTKTDCNLHQKNDTRNAHEECNNGNGGKDYDERNGISTNNGTECSSETLGEATSAMDVIPFESVVESKMLSEVVKKADADTESGHVQNEITEKELEEAIEDANEDSIALNSLHAPPKSYEMNTKAEKSENSENNTSAASKIPHRTLKKRLSANNMNLPAIREEINSRLNDVTMEVNDVYKETTNGQNSAEILVEDKDKVPESPKFPEDRDFLIQKARDDARLCALRGQIAADKAAWSCVVRYPRNTLSQPGSGRSSPLTPDVIRAAAKSPLSTIERKNPFPLSNSPPLTIYKPNFGPKNGTSRLSTFPPLTTPTSVGESRLVTQRNSAMWMPDISHVNNNRRRRITVKGSNITIRELRK